ncbi:choline/ethanolamine kinase [Anthonomus grandis grandis]|uniref:choline/ethanolamine kinase n=1 Tax=Anthonomus grandis grandis TaxID=2921223 RepID=UPI0021661A63|nr:choline/ethanolamine kinase [Anthonomus grandis grandis]
MLNFGNKKLHGDTPEMREVAARICRDYLHGAWRKVTAEDIGFKHISGGLSNLLYHISLPTDLYESYYTKKHHSQEPKEVLIRIYGQTHGEGALEALITESVIFTLLSERGLGPKLHGIFPGGRIEQYINARPLLNKELADEKLSVKIAEKMAALHSMEVPLYKEPTWLWNTIGRWLKTCDKKLKGDIPEFVVTLLRDVDLKSEAKWLRKRLEVENSPVVFCHNDMQEGNILMSMDQDKENNAEEDPELVIIDFEYCSYNYRGFDIANHFMEWVYDYKEDNYPYFRENRSNYPSETQRLTFIKSYLHARGSKENPKKILKEVEIFTLASHLLWTLWAFVNAETSQIPFGYWEFGCSRLQAYFQLKERLSCNMQIKRKVECLSLD